VLVGLGTAVSTNSADGLTATEPGSTTTTASRTTTTRPRPVTPQDNVDWDGVAAALDRWTGVHGEALNDVWDSTNCEDLAFDVEFAIDYLEFPNQSQADSFSEDLALVTASRGELINCTLRFNP
jgi:hypothetical protein